MGCQPPPCDIQYFNPVHPRCHIHPDICGWFISTYMISLTSPEWLIYTCKTNRPLCICMSSPIPELSQPMCSICSHPLHGFLFQMFNILLLLSSTYFFCRTSKPHHPLWFLLSLSSASPLSSTHPIWVFCAAHLMA